MHCLLRQPSQPAARYAARVSEWRLAWPSSCLLPLATGDQSMHGNGVAVVSKLLQSLLRANDLLYLLEPSLRVQTAAISLPQQGNR